MTCPSHAFPEFLFLHELLWEPSPVEEETHAALSKAVDEGPEEETDFLLSCDSKVP